MPLLCHAVKRRDWVIASRRKSELWRFLLAIATEPEKRYTRRQSIWQLILMKTYIVLTNGGHTEDDSGNDTLNCQLVCVCDAPDEQSAIAEGIKVSYELGHEFKLDSYFAYELA